MLLLSKYLLNLYDVKEEPKPEEIKVDFTIPPSWGPFISFGVSAVPADDVSGHYAKKAFCFVTDLGAFVVVTAMNTTFPSSSELQNAKFFEGSYKNTYNGAVYYQNVWEPAISKDLSDRIAYYQGETVMRNIRHTTLARWGWRDGNYSTKIIGYSYTIDQNDVKSFYYNNNLVMTIL